MTFWIKNRCIHIIVLFIMGGTTSHASQTQVQVSHPQMNTAKFLEGQKPNVSIACLPWISNFLKDLGKIISFMLIQTWKNWNTNFTWILKMKLQISWKKLFSRFFHHTRLLSSALNGNLWKNTEYILIVSQSLNRIVFPVFKAFTECTNYFAKHFMIVLKDHRSSCHHH